MNLFFAIAILLAQVSGRYAEWADGPVHHLMTKAELKQWKALRSDAEAQAFIDLFWAKRDPTPDTPNNEFREAFEQRVAFADNTFGTATLRGAMTDRGRVFILLGQPYSITGSGSGNNYRLRARQFWMYAHDKKPKYVPQSDFTLVFEDQGVNEWELARTERANPDVILGEAANGLIVSPTLTRAPFRSDAVQARSKSFRDLLLEGAYKDFRSSGKTSIGSASLTFGEFLSAAGEPFVSAQLYLPNTAGGDSVNFISVIENSAGELVDVNETPATLTAAGPDAYVERSVPLEPGSYTATFGIYKGENFVTAVRAPITVEKIDPAAPGVSPLLIASSVRPLQTVSGPMDPFTFGGFEVVPKGDAQFAPKGDLWYFLELRNPGVSAEGAPKVRVAINIEGRTATGPAAMKFPLEEKKPVKLGDNRYALGTAIPLEGFFPGDYTIKVHVEDAILGKSYDAEKRFRVR